MDMSQYRDLFISEAREHLRTMNGLIGALSGGSREQEDIASLFRMAHSIKGMASAMGYGDISNLAHAMEDVMDGVRKGSRSFDDTVSSLLLEGADLLDGMLDQVEQNGEVRLDTGELVRRLRADEEGAEIAVPAPAILPETIPDVPAPPLPPVAAGPPSDRQQSIRVRTTVLDALIDLTGELVTTKYRLLDSAAGVEAPRLHAAIADFSRLVRQLQQEVSSARLIPFSSLTARFPRAIRELARSQQKQVALEVAGGDVELDRGSLEALADPLIHLLRNAIDHGIEAPHLRQLAGKPPAGILRLSAERGTDQFTVVLEDDGRGMDPARLIELAVERGVVTLEDGWRMSAEQAFMLTCHPGFSTALEVTDVSGRGVGMDAVRSGVHALGGQFTIESTLGRGTRMIIRLPLTIAIVKVLFVDAGGVTMAVPVSAVLRTMEVWRTIIAGTGKGRTVPFEGVPIPVVDLHGLVGGSVDTDTIVPLVVTEMDGRRIAFAVDRFAGQQEAYVKPLGRPLDKLAGLSGSTVLGDGRLVFVLDLPAIVRLADC